MLNLKFNHVTYSITYTLCVHIDKVLIYSIWTNITRVMVVKFLAILEATHESLISYHNIPRRSPTPIAISLSSHLWPDAIRYPMLMALSLWVLVFVGRRRLNAHSSHLQLTPLTYDAKNFGCQLESPLCPWYLSTPHMNMHAGHAMSLNKC